MIALDFFSGSHGHFLEYIVNTYIFNGPRVDNVINDMGTSHNIRHNVDYMNFRLVEARHYTEFDLSSEEPDSVVRISVESDFENICYQINAFCRAGDIPAEKKLLYIPKYIHASKHLLRNDLYSKLIDCGYVRPGNWRWNNALSFNFPLSDLYNINSLYQTLNKLAHFLNHSFSPDDSLYKLWAQFMKKNHAWLYWQTATNLLEKSLSNSDFEFEADLWTQALLNFLLKKTVGIDDGILHNTDDYPSNTAIVYQIIQQHIEIFDQKF